MNSYIEYKKNLYTSILEFLEESNEQKDDDIDNELYQKLINIFNSQQIEGDRNEMRAFLEIIKSISENHHRHQHFNNRVNQLLLHYKNQIKQTLSNTEIYHLFENNKNIILFLLQNDIITITDEIYKEMIHKIEKNGKYYWHFFIPELENFVGEEKMKFIKNELLKENPNFFTNYELKRQKGENESYTCSLIRQDLIEDFISHISRQNISPLSQIIPSIFETNPFLNEHQDTTLIEYAAFFGSIQIFKYLFNNKVELTQSLWFYSIHSNNPEIISFIESNDFPPPEDYKQCLFESIKCHHNNISDYIENNLLEQTKNDLQQQEQEEEIISKCCEYYNYSYFQYDIIYKYGFFYLQLYHYNKLVKLLLKEKEEYIEKKIILIFKYFYQEMIS